jgi:hypothetical protein
VNDGTGQRQPSSGTLKSASAFTIDRIAVHEAAHAVIAFVLGVGPTGASVVPDIDTLGHVSFTEQDAVMMAWKFRGKNRDETRAYVLARAMISMAGAAGERAFGWAVDQSSRADTPDETHAKYYVAFAYGYPPRRHDLVRIERRLRRVTAHMVHRHRGAIERVSAALVASGTLDGSQLHEIMDIADSPGAQRPHID